MYQEEEGSVRGIHQLRKSDRVGWKRLHEDSSLKKKTDRNVCTFSSVGTVSLGVARLNAWSKVTKMTRVSTTA